jgi:hypothetical protein
VSLNPVTLVEEPDWEREERQAATGQLGNGINVSCRPDPYDPNIIQIQHRAVCLRRPYAGCFTCPHQAFTLVFRAQPYDPYEIIACPRWRTPADRIAGESPATYVPVERATCSKRPYDFCPSCPTKEAVEDFDADKVRPGWYGRWHRIMKEMCERDDDDS